MHGSAEEEQLSRAIDAIVMAARQLDTTPRTTAQGVRDAVDAREILHRLAQALARADTPNSLDTRNQVQLAQAELEAGAIAKQRSALPALNRALAGLRNTTSIEELADEVPYQSVQLGYDRVLFSWVDQEHWVPRAAHITGAPSMAKALVEAGGPPYVHTRELLEVDIVRDRRPLLVREVEGNPRVHQRLWAITRSRGYVAAPVIARGRVAALVHLDRHIDNDPIDEFDRDLLAAFCQGVGLMIDQLFTASNNHQHPSALTPSWPTALTRRELEVLHLLATGLTNAEIGARLYISNETVKTHVARLMRKLGVSRRSQAAAAYVDFRRAHQNNSARVQSADSDRAMPDPESRSGLGGARPP